MTTTEKWSPNYVDVFKFRQKQVLAFRKDAQLVYGAKQYYKQNPIDFINHWCDTYDPRNAGERGKLTTMPLCLFERQKQLVQFLSAMIEGKTNGIIEKARDMGATWVCCAYSVWLWLFFEGACIGWGSRKEMLVDRIGDPGCIFEKMRDIINSLPKELKPYGFDRNLHMPFMKIINPENNSTIVGEGGDNIGRGHRTLVYFKDESAHYEHPEKVESSLGDTTKTQIDISSVNGLGNVFHRKTEEATEWQVGKEVDDSHNYLFVMDWRDHPHKTQEWYDKRKEKAIKTGTLHLFAQEVDRSYDASVEATIIPAEWVTACIDAHIKLGFDDSGEYVGGLDVADGGTDKNALAVRKGVVLKYLDEWHERDTGQTARKVKDYCKELGVDIEIQYDSIGVGAGVKAETNRLKDEKEMPEGVSFISWEAGASPQYKDKRVIEDDDESPLNGDFYANLKAQGWWELRTRFLKTYYMITDPDNYFYEANELISLPKDLNNLHTLRKELSQPKRKTNLRGKLLVDKMPEGTKSPNLADAVMMMYFPIESKFAKFDVIEKHRLIR